MKEENKEEYFNDNKSDLNGSSIVIPIKAVRLNSAKCFWFKLIFY